MSDRIKKSWTVLDSIETEQGDFCVDFFQKEDGCYGFELFRKDPEDLGKWTGLYYYSSMSYSTYAEAKDMARQKIPWLAGEQNK